MRTISRALACTCILWVTVLLSGCASTATNKLKTSTDTPYWQGRLSLTVHNTPPTSLTADFELEGNKDKGALRLNSPLGNVLAALNWSPAGAQLTAQGSTQQFDSLEALVLHATGTPLPVAQLFDWVQGLDTSAEGWQTDLSNYQNMRIQARRVIATTAELKIILSSD
ncbi:outer membrane lipoprotein LolB [Rhodoferax aquaticus]|uniref:Outer-membrane lipoprotein LolB n=1 Tax=Rhodoferax aquaticus TaxID=2527691 RepID=A0A515ELM2_9BURK|nr:outer membrane lipoprotein LolB [Rhodoferax aquaticus]QDL53558.1 outer membrane lipoprotein LolB [Rhodoferax aquaticus]